MITAIVTTALVLQRQRAPLRDRIAARAVQPAPTDCDSCRAIAADVQRRPTTDQESPR